MLLLRDVVAREPGAATPLLRADRIYLSLPWSTIRARGSDLTVKRIELDRPQLDLPALQRWLATRPPSEKRFPTLTDGLRITDGAIANDDDSDSGWRIDRHPRRRCRRCTPTGRCRRGCAAATSIRRWRFRSTSRWRYRGRKH